MRLIPVNEAEAIIEPFWDGGSSEYPKDKYSLLSEYTVTAAPGADATASQLWYCAEVSIRSAEPGRAAVILSRPCDIEIDGYDVFRVFGALPKNMRLSVRARIDGAAVAVIDGYAGTNDTDEIDGAFSGRKLTALELLFESADGKPCSAVLMWLGLSNRAAQERMEQRKCAWPPDWPGHFLPDPGKPAPQIGIYLGAEELAELRGRLRQSGAGAVYGRIREKAREDAAIVPEEIIGTFVPFHTQFCRRRDRSRPGLAEAMERLAFVGLVEENNAMCRLACRMALSAACCSHWCESEMGAFPGATWHHRSFTEEVYSQSCALVLDWAGHCLTPYGRQVITDAIAMKGLPRIESDFKRMEYIRHMNQGIVFSTGRIAGLIALSRDYPRYRTQVSEAEADLMEMLGLYICDDGGALEGIIYWNFTLSNVMRSLKALSGWHGVPFREYVPEIVERTGKFALAMHSTTSGGSALLPLGDALVNETVSPALAAAYFNITGMPEWKEIYGKADASRKTAPDIFQVLFHTEALGCGNTALPAASGLTVLNDIGYASLRGCMEAVGPMLFFYSSGPLSFGHYHEDKGSFILEAGGESLAMDRGITDYSDPESKHMKRAEYHNLLYPESEDGIKLAQPPGVPGGRLGPALFRDGLALLASSQKDAWASGVFDTNIRRVVSPGPGLYVIDDEIDMPEARHMTFNVNSPHLACEAQDGSWRIEAAGVVLRVLPLNWKPVKAFAGADGVDGASRPAYRLGLTAQRAWAHRLMTLLEVLPAGGDSRYQCKTASENAIELVSEGLTLGFDTGTPGTLRVRLRDACGAVYSAVCREMIWEFGEE